MMKLSILSLVYLVCIPASAAPTINTPTDCTGKFRANPRHSYECGVEGTLSNPAILASYEEIAPQTCIDYCMNNASCISHSFDYNQGYDISDTFTCTLYSKPLSHQGFSNSSSLIYFYNRHCFSCATAEETACPTITGSTAPGTFQRYYIGAGYEATQVSPFTSSPFWHVLNGTYATDCDAIQACADIPVDTYHYAYDGYGFGVYRFRSNGTWVCETLLTLQWFDVYFNISNPDVEIAFGYLDGF